MKGVLVSIAAASVLLLAANAQADADLAKSSGCLNCHTVDNKLVGPALKEVAAKYAGQDDAVAYLSGKIKEGSNGVWGPVPMPPNTMVSDENAQVLAEFILSLK